MTVPPTIPVIPARKLALQALQIAVAYAAAGVHEEGGNNRGDQVEFFQHLMGGNPGDPWCADFVSSCFVKAYAELTGQPETRTDLPHYVPAVNSHFFPLSGYCPDLWKGAQLRGLAKPKGFPPSPGDIVLYDFNGQGKPHHTGIVRQANGDGTLSTVEGNTSSGDPGSQADGDGVYKRVRTRNSVFGFIHLG